MANRCFAWVGVLPVSDRVAGRYSLRVGPDQAALADRRVADDLHDGGQV